MKTALLIATVSFYASAQAPGDPFTLIRVVRNAYGSGPDAGSLHAYRTAGADVLGMKSITGASQTWMVEAHGSFASIEAVDQALAATAPATDHGRGFPYEGIPTTNLIGMYRPGLSYRPDEALRLLPAARYFQISIYRIRSGSRFDFAELMRRRKLSFDSINLDRPEMGYQVISGATSGMYIFLAPLQSLRTLDNAWAKLPVYAEEGGAKGARQGDPELEISREHLLFRVEPGISAVSDAFASGAPDFWHPRTK